MNSEFHNFFSPKRKRNKIIYCVAAIMVILIVFCSLFRSTIKEGFYQMVSGGENAVFYPWLRIENSSFEFYYDSYSSTIYTGNYRIEKKQLILESNVDNGKKFVFTIDGDNLIFDEKQSSECVQEVESGVNARLIDGAIFERSE